MADRNDYDRIADDLTRIGRLLLHAVRDAASDDGDCTPVQTEGVLRAVVEVERTRAWVAALGEAHRG